MPSSRWMHHVKLNCYYCYLVDDNHANHTELGLPQRLPGSSPKPLLSGLEYETPGCTTTLQHDLYQFTFLPLLLLFQVPRD
jgi:hypothetical protein